MLKIKNLMVRHEDGIERTVYRHPVISLVFVQIFSALLLLGVMAAFASLVGCLVWAAGALM